MQTHHSGTCISNCCFTLILLLNHLLLLSPQKIKAHFHYYYTYSACLCQFSWRQPTGEDSAGSSSRDQLQGNRLLKILNLRTVREQYLYLGLILISKQVQRNPHP